MRNPSDLRRFRDVAERAARAGGSVIRSALGVTRLEEKGVGDYVTDVDHKSEAAILELLDRESGGIPVLAEEEGGQRTNGLMWTVDPLDGTTNFVHNFPVVGVSVALLDEGRPVAACVHAPMLDATFAAVRGGGAWTEGKRMRVSERAPREGIVATGFPFRDRSFLPRYLRMLEGALETFEDLRRPGTASLDLAWTASGVFDGFFELNLGTWDVAGGILLVEEAGGVTSDWGGGDAHVETGHILAGSPQVHRELLRLASGLGGLPVP